MNTNSKSEERQAAIEALAVWECNRRTKRIKDAGGASSWFHECLPEAQCSFRKWAEDVLDLIIRIRGNGLL